MFLLGDLSTPLMSPDPYIVRSYKVAEFISILLFSIGVQLWSQYLKTFFVKILLPQVRNYQKKRHKTETVPQMCSYEKVF